MPRRFSNPRSSDARTADTWDGSPHAHPTHWPRRSTAIRYPSLQRGHVRKATRSMSRPRKRQANASAPTPEQIPPGRCVIVASKAYRIDESDGERRALAAMKTHGVQTTAVLIDGHATTEQLRAPDLTNPPPRLLGLIGKRFGTREVIGIERGPAPKYVSFGYWFAVVRCPAGHIANKTPSVLKRLRGCGACRLESQRRIKRARFATE